MFKAHLLEQRNRDVLLIEAFEWDIFGLQNIKIDSWNILLTLVILNDFVTNIVTLLFLSAFISEFMLQQGCIICSILPSRMGARGVSSEHVESMEMFSCSPTYICLHLLIFK